MIQFENDVDKKSVFQTVQEFILTKKLSIQEKDETRPWGGYFVISERSLSHFIELFFPGFNPDQKKRKQVLSPKILIVEPNKRLSWQYHHRRSELWKILNGPVGIVISDDDSQKKVQAYESGDLITIDCGQRHRLIGLDDWGVVAEIWNHTDPENPSEEDDIVRLEDDFGR